MDRKNNEKLAEIRKIIKARGFGEMYGMSPTMADFQARSRLFRPGQTQLVETYSVDFGRFETRVVADIAMKGALDEKVN